MMQTGASFCVNSNSIETLIKSVVLGKLFHLFYLRFYEWEDRILGTDSLIKNLFVTQ